jgi:predicted Zn finger-like uncharacterized protein
VPRRHAPGRRLAVLVTTCRHCEARFRVTPEQLNLRQGQVRCGQCGMIFNGFEALERFPGDDTGARLLASRAAARSSADAAGTPPGFGAGAARRPEPPAHREPPPDLADIPPLPDESEPVAKRPRAAAAEARAASSDETPAPSTDEMQARAPHTPASRTPVMAAALLEDYEPAPPARPSRAWSFGVVLLGLLLALQATYAFRSQIAQQYPVLRPPLEAVCAAAGCKVPWLNNEAALKLEDSELLEVPGKPGQIALQARVRNLSSAAQEFPHLELTLTDNTGQTAVRRVLRPADYLGRAPQPGEVMPAGSEALLSVRIETGNLRPTGYELLLFYP